MNEYKDRENDNYFTIRWDALGLVVGMVHYDGDNGFDGEVRIQDIERLIELRNDIDVSIREYTKHKLDRYE